MISLFIKKILLRSGLNRLFPHFCQLSRGDEIFQLYYNNEVLATPVADLHQTQPFFQHSSGEGIDLASGTPRFDLVPSGSNKLPADQRGYPHPRGLPELRETIAERLRRKHQIETRFRDEILITHGATGALHTIVNTLVNPGQQVVLFDPTSPVYSLALKQRRARIRWIPTQMENGHIRFRMDHLAKALNRSRLLILAQPNNPNGGAFTPEDLEQIAWWANQHDVLIINDLVFADYLYEPYPIGITDFARAFDRTLTIGSVSKSHALTAARVGWLTGNRSLVAACALRASSYNPFVPTLCQQIALSALRLEDQTWQPFLNDFVSRRQYVHDRLTGVGLKAPWPTGGVFFWVPVSSLGLTGQQFAEQLWRSQQVSVWPGECFGPGGKGYVRLSYVIEEGRLRQGLTRLVEYVRSLQSHKAAEETETRATQWKVVLAR